MTWNDFIVTFFPRPDDQWIKNSIYIVYRVSCRQLFWLYFTIAGHICGYLLFCLIDFIVCFFILLMQVSKYFDAFVQSTCIFTCDKTACFIALNRTLAKTYFWKAWLQIFQKQLYWILSYTLQCHSLFSARQSLLLFAQLCIIYFFCNPSFKPAIAFCVSSLK